MPVTLTKELIESTPAPATGSAPIWDDKQKGFGVRIFAPTGRHPKGARSFFLDYWIDGIERRFTIGNFPDWSVMEARAEAKALRKRVDRGEDPARDKRARRDAPTVAELAERYKAEHLPGKAPKSQHDDWQKIETYILPFKASAHGSKMAERKVTDVHSGDIEALHRAISEGGQPVLANRVLAVASTMFSLALKTRAGENKPWRDAVLGNPCKGVRRNSEDGRERFFSPAEIAAITDALNEYSDLKTETAANPNARVSAESSANCIRFIMLTGCRPAEAMVATWKQVDAEPGFWVRPSAHTKQRKVHKAPLNPPVLELLARMRRDRAKAQKAGAVVSAWIFPGQIEGEHLTQLRSCWHWVRERATVLLWAGSDDADVAGLVADLRESLNHDPFLAECRAAAAVKNIELPAGLDSDRAYDLRHSFASFGAAGGLSLEIIGKLLGHTQPRTTKRYAHLADDAMRAAADKIGGVIAGAGSPGAVIVPQKRSA